MLIFSSYHFLRFEGNFPKDPRRVEDLREVDGAGGKGARKRCFRTTSLLASFGGAHGGDGRMVFGLRDRVLKVCVVEIRVSG